MRTAKSGNSLRNLTVIVLLPASVVAIVIALSLSAHEGAVSFDSKATAQGMTLHGAPDIETGVNKSLSGHQVFAADDPWNTDISKEPADPASEVLINSIGNDRFLHPDFGASYNGGPFGISYDIVSGKQPKVPVQFSYADQSDPGPYPIPPDAPIEGGAKSDGDRHVIVVDKDNWMLYELFASVPLAGGASWRADSGAVFDLSRHSMQRRPGWTSADAAGLPILPGLVRYDEVMEQGKITHALRFTVQHSRRAFTAPATHFASRSDDDGLPPMGMRVRLKSDFDISAFPPSARVILQAMKTYGMILADNGSNWFISGTADPRWNDEEISALKRVRGSNFEVVRMGQIYTKTIDPLYRTAICLPSGQYYLDPR